MYIKNQLLANYFSQIYWVGCDNCKINCHICHEKEFTVNNLTLYKRISNFFPLYFKKNQNEAYIYIQDNGKCIYHNDLKKCDIYENRPDICKRYPFNTFLEDNEHIIEFQDMLCSGVLQGQSTTNSFPIVQNFHLTKQAENNFFDKNIDLSINDNANDIIKFIEYLNTNKLLISIKNYKINVSNIFKRNFDDIYIVDESKINTKQIPKEYLALINTHLESLKNFYKFSEVIQ